MRYSGHHATLELQWRDKALRDVFNNNDCEEDYFKVCTTKSVNKLKKGIKQDWSNVL